MRMRGFGYRAALAVTVVAASLWFAPVAFAHTHVGFGVTIGVGNCWGCGYRAAPPVYYAPVYPAPRYYYPQPVYYAPAPVYYGYSYGYRTPYSYRHYDHRGYYHHPRRHERRGGWHHRGHYYHGHR